MGWEALVVTLRAEPETFSSDKNFSEENKNFILDQIKKVSRVAWRNKPLNDGMLIYHERSSLQIPHGTQLQTLWQRHRIWICCATTHITNTTASRPIINPLTPNNLYSRSAVSPLKIKIPIKNMREKPTNTPIAHSVY
jgi:hypothetical protein